MKNVLTKYLFVLFSLSILTSLFFGCNKEPFHPPENMTPVETVQFRFEKWNEKKTKERDSVVREEMRGLNSGLSNMKYVNLLKCVEKEDEIYSIGHVRDLHPGYSQYSVVQVEFEIEFKSKWRDTGGFNTGKSTMEWYYGLGKMDEESDWLILSWGR